MVASARPDPQAAGRRDPGLGDLHLHRQDRHADREPHAGRSVWYCDGALGPSTAGVRPAPGTTCCGHGPVQRRRSRRPTGRDRRRPDRGRALVGRRGTPASRSDDLEQELPRVARDAVRLRAQVHDHGAPGRRRRVLVLHEGGGRGGRWSARRDVATSSGRAPLDAPSALRAVSERMAAGRPARPGHRHAALVGAARRRSPPEIVERDLTLLGSSACVDPPREEARDAVAHCQGAGIVPVMITGDHPLTAAGHRAGGSVSWTTAARC